jgi:hypothetical protein
VEGKLKERLTLGLDAFLYDDLVEFPGELKVCKLLPYKLLRKNALGKA